MGTIALVIVGAGLCGSIVAFAFYSLKAIRAEMNAHRASAIATVIEQNKVKKLSEDILLWADAHDRLKNKVTLLEKTNAELLKNAKLNPGDVISDERLRGIVPKT